MSSTTEQSTLREVMVAQENRAAMSRHTGLVGIVVAFHSDRGTIDVQPIPTLLDERATARVFPVLPDVPFMYPRAGSLRVTWPLAKGDVVWLLFCERALSGWVEGGNEVTADTRRTPLDSAVAIPGPWPLSSPTAQSGGVKVEYAGARVEITPGGNIQIDAGAGTVGLGNTLGGEALERVSQALSQASLALTTIINASFPPPAGTMDPLQKPTAQAAIAQLDAAKNLLDQIKGPL